MVVPFVGLPESSVHVKAAPPHSCTSMPRCLRYQLRRAAGSLALKKMPPMPVTRFMWFPLSVVLVKASAAGRDRRRVGDAELRQPIQVLPPLRVVGLAQLAQIRPGVEPCVVTVVEPESHRVMADGLDRVDADLVLAELQRFLSGAVAADLRR